MNFFTQKINLTTADLGRQIKNGEAFVRDGIILKTNYYSLFFSMGGVKVMMPELENNIDIHRFMWGRKFSKNALMYLDKEKSKKLFMEGWEDTEKNRDTVLLQLKELKDP